jgi:CheY-like chemotaxis protein
VELRGLLRQAAGATEEHRRQADVRFRLHLPRRPVWAEADPTRIVQCAVNLLVNAAKFTPPGGENCLELETRRDLAWVRVRDTGIGIEPAALPGVWQVFTQGDASLDRSQGGLGLGLPLVKSLVELHGGGVLAASDGPGRGAEFAFWLPLLKDEGLRKDEGGRMKDESEPPNAEAPRGHPTPNAGSLHPSAFILHPSRRVLVVDDNLAARETLCDLLEGEGYAVIGAASAAEALEQARREPPDVVVSDIGLPGADGFDLAARFRSELPHTRLIALSGYSQDEYRARAREAGFDAYLVKPMDLPGLLEQIRGM